VRAYFASDFSRKGMASRLQLGAEAAASGSGPKGQIAGVQVLEPAQTACLPEALMDSFD
jgi:hypothetical protein